VVQKARQQERQWSTPLQQHPVIKSVASGKQMQPSALQHCSKDAAATVNP
jgi:hypothetical protein